MITLVPEGWTEWGAWSECSATCGISLRERTRQCNSPRCAGQGVDIEMCKVQQCVTAASTNGVSSTTSLTDKETKPGKDKLPDQKSGSEQVSDYPNEGVSAIYIKSINMKSLLVR